MRLRMSGLIWLAVLLPGVLAVSAAPGGQPDHPPEINDSLLPYCWRVASTYVATAADLRRMSEKFGSKVSSIENIKIDAAGIELQVNIVGCHTVEEAKKTIRYLRTSDPSPDKYVVTGNRVYEFMCHNHFVVMKMKDLLGLLETPVRKWRVKMEVAPLAKSRDDMKWNEFYNAAAAHRVNPEDEESILTILDLAPNFDFGHTLSVRMEKPGWGEPVYRFEPRPNGRSVSRDRLEVTFDELPRVVGVPRIKIDVVVPTRSFGNFQPTDWVDKYMYLRATDPWPIAHSDVRAALTECYDPGWTTRQKVESILCWVYHNVEYHGDKVGSRYGTVQVLRQRYGYCWDKSDVFVTMCRTVDIPARQVFGWLYGQSGHVWAEVYLDDEGWVSVDPTCSWLGVTDEYIPLFVSETGHPPFVYTMTPEITQVTD